MKKSHLLLLVALLSLMLSSCFAQTKGSEELNLSFEKLEKGLPELWQHFGAAGSVISIDSTSVRDGKYSVLLEVLNEGSSKVLSLVLPQNYVGKEITLSGYFKTENVTDGHAGLFMSIEPKIAFDNMGNRGLTGTNDWTKCEITLPLNPAKTKQIVIGAMLVGKGKVWIDDLHIGIDGKDISEAEIYIKELKPAELDKEYDSGSNIVFPALSDQLVDNLELLGRIWGFMKYHHPEIGKGNYNWDYELFRVLPQYLKADNKDVRDEVLFGWINKYGKPDSCKNCKPTAEDAFLKPDLKWVEDIGMSKELKNVIRYIYENRYQGEHFYISRAPDVGYPVFNNENPYVDMPYPDQGFRLLSLYRYWNMVKYFFPYTYVTDKNWNTVLQEYIPKFILAKDELEYELAALQIVGEVTDSHANLYGDKIAKLRGAFFAPLRVKFIEGKLIVFDFYNSKLVDDIKIGDEITHINGKTINSIVDSLRIYYPASNEEGRLESISRDLLRSSKNKVSIKYISLGKEIEKEISLYSMDELDFKSWEDARKKGSSYNLLDGNIGYVTLEKIKQGDIPKIKEEFKNTKGIIIDIRNYPAFSVQFLLGSYFVEKDTDFVRFSIGNINNPGEFNLTPALKIRKGHDTYQGKLIVLVNEESVSLSEYTAMALRAGARTTIVGSTTAGADGDISSISLPGGLHTTISGIGVYYPNGGQTQRIGIVPDVEVRPTVKGIKEGRDELLEKAIEIINAN